MSKTRFQSYPWPATGSRLGLWVLLLALIQGTAGLASDLHWTETNLHRGVLVCTAPTNPPTALDHAGVLGGRGFIGSFSLRYMIGTRDQYPVQEFKFQWDWSRADVAVTNRHSPSFSTRDLAKYPDLAKQFFAIKPVWLALGADLEFYDAKGKQIGSGRKTIRFDLPAQSGSNIARLLPPSSQWADFFKDDSDATKMSAEKLTDRHQRLLAQTTSLLMVAPRLLQIEWPEKSLELIAMEFARREQDPKRKAAASRGVKAQTTESSATNNAHLNPLERSAGSPNPFEAALFSGRAASENPIERTLRLEREERLRQEAADREKERRSGVGPRPSASRLGELHPLNPQVLDRTIRPTNSEANSWLTRWMSNKVLPTRCVRCNGIGQVPKESPVSTSNPFPLKTPGTTLIKCPVCGGTGWQ